jgi:hypothetical protein
MGGRPRFRLAGFGPLADASGSMSAPGEHRTARVSEWVPLACRILVYLRIYRGEFATRVTTSGFEVSFASRTSSRVLATCRYSELAAGRTSER